MNSYTYQVTTADQVLRNDGLFIPNDPSNTDWQEYQSWINEGNTPTPRPAESPIEFLKKCETAAQEYMDAFARTRGYDDMRAAVSYKDDPYGPFAADGAYALQARSNVWQCAQAIENSVRAGTMQAPKTVADFLALLPKLTWPE